MKNDDNNHQYHLVTWLLGQQKCNRERISMWNAEQRLICDLLDNYQVKWGRPVRNMTEDVEVRFGLQLIHISDLVRFSHFLCMDTNPSMSIVG